MYEPPHIDEERTWPSRVLEFWLRTEKSFVVVPLDLVRPGVFSEVLIPLYVVGDGAGRGRHADYVEVACGRKEEEGKFW